MAQNQYKVDLREFKFVLFEHLQFGQILGKAPFEPWGVDEVDMVLKELERFAYQVTGPLNQVGDQVGCKLEKGQVQEPPGFKAAWDKLYEAGWKSLAVPEEFGGQGAPYTLHLVAEEFLSGSNVAFSTYPGLAFGVGEVIAEFGTPAQKKKYVEKLFDGTFGGTMCLTEPQAGSDVGASSSTAKKRADGLYNIQGTKIFITAGDHTMSDTIVHMVLARVDGAPEGTKGLSMFIVPKHRVNDDGSLAGANDVVTVSIEHKMGLSGSSTCVLNFGENGDCVGELLGTDENDGMRQMFRLMNGARIGVAIQGLSLASSAYLNALAYTKERKQGPSAEKWKDPSAPKVFIIEHADVRRMLLDMKARVEGIRALVFKLGFHFDLARLHKGKDDQKEAYHMGHVDLLTPILKSYASDQAFRVCEMAIQTYGGVGYTREFPVEQNARDSKVFSIYEGTNHIQALDLVARKLMQRGGENFRTFLGEISKFASEHGAHAVFGKEAKTLGKAAETLGAVAMQFMGWAQGGKFALIPLAANRFLNAMAEVAVAWMLLDQARVAVTAKEKLAAGHTDIAFYDGKINAALYFARNVLPEVFAAAEIMKTGDTSPLDIANESFATI